LLSSVAEGATFSAALAPREWVVDWADGTAPQTFSAGATETVVSHV
jgi:hypothetical protein